MPEIAIDNIQLRSAFTFYEPKYGDTVNVFLDHHDQFHVAYRYINGRSDESNIITYDSLAELPSYYRQIVEDIIWHWHTRKYRNPPPTT